MRVKLLTAFMYSFTAKNGVARSQVYLIALLKENWLNMVVFKMRTLFGSVSNRSLARKTVYGLKFHAVVFGYRRLRTGSLRRNTSIHESKLKK